MSHHTWRISSFSPACAGCGSRFEKGAEVVSNVTEEGEGFVRRDYCLSCWEKMNGKKSFYFWKTVFSPRHKKKIFVDDETLFDFFVRLQEEDSLQKQRFRYVLSLVLMRKKLLAFHDVEREGDHQYLLLRDGRGGEYRVLDPHMDGEAVEAVKEEMQEIFHREFLAEG